MLDLEAITRELEAMTGPADAATYTLQAHPIICKVPALLAEVKRLRQALGQLEAAGSPRWVQRWARRVREQTGRQNEQGK